MLLSLILGTVLQRGDVVGKVKVGPLQKLQNRGPIIVTNNSYEISADSLLKRLKQPTISVIIQN